MIKVDFPKLIFSKWYSWKNRLEYPLHNYPGLYLIAISEKNLNGKNSKLEDADYIGKTVSKGGLKKRWYQFNQTIRGKEGHSGGKTILKSFGKTYEQWGNENQLFVAGFGLDSINLNQYTSESNLIIFGQIAYLEYYAFSKYFKFHGKLPKFHTQHQVKII